VFEYIYGGGTAGSSGRAEGTFVAVLTWIATVPGGVAGAASAASTTAAARAARTPRTTDAAGKPVGRLRDHVGEYAARIVEDYDVAAATTVAAIAAIAASAAPAAPAAVASRTI
jgi:hypothetical protein